jgi:hypothetical protein
MALIDEVRKALNGAENGSNTPDFVLAEFVLGCIATFDEAVKRRDHWYGEEREAAAAAVGTVHHSVPSPLPTEAEQVARFKGQAEAAADGWKSGVSLDGLASMMGMGGEAEDADEEPCTGAACEAEVGCGVCVEAMLVADCSSAKAVEVLVARNDREPQRESFSTPEDASKALALVEFACGPAAEKVPIMRAWLPYTGFVGMSGEKRLSTHEAMVAGRQAVLDEIKEKLGLAPCEECEGMGRIADEDECATRECAACEGLGWLLVRDEEGDEGEVDTAAVPLLAELRKEVDQFKEVLAPLTEALATVTAQRDAARASAQGEPELMVPRSAIIARMEALRQDEDRYHRSGDRDSALASRSSMIELEVMLGENLWAVRCDDGDEERPRELRQSTAPEPVRACDHSGDHEALMKLLHDIQVAGDLQEEPICWRTPFGFWTVSVFNEDDQKKLAALNVPIGHDSLFSPVGAAQLLLNALRLAQEREARSRPDAMTDDQKRAVLKAAVDAGEFGPGGGVTFDVRAVVVDLATGGVLTFVPEPEKGSALDQAVAWWRGRDAAQAQETDDA